MAKEVITFRIDDDLRSKLSHLQQLDVEASLKQKRKPKGRSEIIAEAIDTYYMSVLADRYSDPYMQRLEMAFERVFRKYMSVLIRSNNMINMLSRESREYMRLLCKGLNIDRARDGVENLLYMTMPWDLLIPEKVAREMKVIRAEDGDSEDPEELL